MAAEEPRKGGWWERRKAAKREKAEQTGDSPEKRAARERHPKDPDVQGAATRAGIGGELSGGF
jgi:hypothetical protein